MIEYRKALAEDAKGLLEYNSIVGRETDFLSFGSNTFKITEEREAKFILRFYNSKKDEMLVALDGNKIVANASIEHNRIDRYSHRAELSITVLRDYWGKGIGSELVRRLIEFSKNAGIEILSLEVRSDNERAVALYKKFGFKSIGKYERFFKIGDQYYAAELMNLYL